MISYYEQKFMKNYFDNFFFTSLFLFFKFLPKRNEREKKRMSSSLWHVGHQLLGNTFENIYAKINLFIFTVLIIFFLITVLTIPFH